MIMLSQVASTKLKIVRKVDTNPQVQEEQHVDPFGANDTKFLILGDTGQVDTYFEDYIRRKMIVDDKSNPKQKTLKPLVGGKFSNFERIMEPLKSTKYDQGIILGDFVYTENKKAGVTLSKVTAENLKSSGFKRDLKYKDSQEVTTLFTDRLEESTKYLKTLLKSYSSTTSFWLLLNGNHSYDVDATAEKYYMNEDKSTVRIYKHSKVHISKDVCFLDLNYGDLACLGSTYLGCFEGALLFSRYGKNEDETLNALAKLIEATLTGSLCRDQWRVVRTHAAAFNTEVDNGALMKKIDAQIDCKLRVTAEEIEKNLNKDLLELKDFKPLSEVLNILEKSKFKLTASILEKNSPGIGIRQKDNTVKAIVNRLFTCKANKSTTASPFSVMQIVNRAKPHFTLASHLHASQVLFAKKAEDIRDIKWAAGNNYSQTPITGCKEINNIPDFNFADKMDYSLKDCPSAETNTEFTIKDNPDYDIIFVIGNSGRFLDQFFDGKNSSSHIVWQRINTGPEGLAIDLSGKKSATDKDVTNVINADKKTAYGFAEFTTTSNSAATIVFKELDPNKGKGQIVSVLKIQLKKGAESVPKYTISSPSSSSTPSKQKRKLK